MYTHPQWNNLLKETVETIDKLSTLKGGEYAGDDDRLANFRRNAANLGLDMRQVWAIYAAKHIDAVMQYVKDVATGKTRERMEPISGRLDDIIVYCILMKAIVEEIEGNTVAADNALLGGKNHEYVSNGWVHRFVEDEWCDWKGVTPPVSEYRKVTVEKKSGEITTKMACAFDWHPSDMDPIVKFMVHPE